MGRGKNKDLDASFVLFSGAFSANNKRIEKEEIEKNKEHQKEKQRLEKIKRESEFEKELRREPVYDSFLEAYTWTNPAGQLHRDFDLPALHSKMNLNKKEWYQNGVRHRDGDRPAVKSNYGKEYYKNGELHRDNDLPAVDLADGRKQWWKNGKKHRDGGKPAIINREGTKEYWENDVWIKTILPNGETVYPLDT